MISDKIIVGLLLSAFFPYFFGGVRLEHLVFPSALLIFGFISIFHTNAISLPVLAMSSLLFVGAAFAFMNSADSPDAGTNAPVLTMGVRLILPAIVLATIVWHPSPKYNLVKSVAQTIVWIAVPLSALAMCSVFFDMSWLLNLYVQSGDDAVWSSAFAIGRFTGLFNQPLEAGIFYSIALLSFVYLTSINWSQSMGRNIFFPFILVGGSLSLSKNFVVLGVLIALIYAISVRVLSIRSGVAVLGLIIAAIGGWLMFGNENYANSFVDLYAEGGFLLAVTAGRLGTTDTQVAQLWGHLLNSGNWVTGIGLGSHLPLDNGYLEYFYQGGVLSLVCYLLFIASIFIFSIRHWPDDTSKLLLSIGLLVVGSSLGGPVVSASRANVPLLLLMVSCVLRLDSKKIEIAGV